MRQAWRVVGLFFLLNTLALAVLAGPVAAQGNSEAVNLCKNGGWATQYRADGSPFANQGECVSYAARENSLVGRGPIITATLGESRLSQDFFSVDITGSRFTANGSVVLQITLIGTTSTGVERGLATNTVPIDASSQGEIAYTLADDDYHCGTWDFTDVGILTPTYVKVRAVDVETVKDARTTVLVNCAS